MQTVRYYLVIAITLFMVGCSQQGTTLKNGKMSFDPSELYQSAKTRLLGEQTPISSSDDMMAETKSSAQAFNQDVRVAEAKPSKPEQASSIASSTTDEMLEVKDLIIEEALSKKTYPINFDDMFEKAMITVKTLGWDVMIADPQTGVLIAETSTISVKAPFNMGTWGQDVQVLIKRLPNDEVEVIAKTKEKEFGKKKNIPRFFHELQSLINQTDVELEQLG